MKQIHQHEKEQFKKLFKHERIDRFEDRLNTLNIFLQTEKHVTVNELCDLLEKNGLKYEPDFVRETLRFMCRYGFAEKNRFDKGPTRYEHRHIGRHHDHLICTKCKKIIEFNNEQLENLQLQISANYDFHQLWHKTEIYGLCSDCLHERMHIMPLVSAKEGERIFIKGFTGGSRAQMRLLSMGLRPGDELEVITSHGKGQMVVAADLKRFVLGHGLARKIMVEPVK